VLLTHILNFFQIIVVVLQSREMFLRLVESKPNIQTMVVSSLIEKNPFSYREGVIASGCGAHMLAILRRMVISFAHAFPPPPDTITISPPPPRPQDQLPHCLDSRRGGFELGFGLQTSEWEEEGEEAYASTAIREKMRGPTNKLLVSIKRHSTLSGYPNLTIIVIAI